MSGRLALPMTWPSPGPYWATTVPTCGDMVCGPPAPSSAQMGQAGRMLVSGQVVRLSGMLGFQICREQPILRLLWTFENTVLAYHNMSTTCRFTYRLEVEIFGLLI